MALEPLHHQMAGLEEIRAHPYFKKFEPRAYHAYEERKKNPIPYLEEIGIEKIGEMIQEGFPVSRIAAILAIPPRVITKWISNNPDYVSEIFIAEKLQAGECVYKAEQVLLESVSTPLQLTQKVEQSKFYRWKAAQLDKDKYGTAVKDKQGADNMVVFNVNFPSLNKEKTIDSTAKVIENLPKNTLDLSLLLSEETIIE